MAEPLYWRNTTVLAGVEDTYGEGATLTGSHALRLLSAELKIIDGQTIDRSYVRAKMGAPEKTHVGVHRSAKLTAELAGSGTAGEVPGTHALLLASAMAGSVRAVAATVQASPGTPAAGNDGAWTYVSTPYTGSVPRTVTVTCTTGGGSGTARVTVAAPAVAGPDGQMLPALEVTNVTVTTGTAIPLAGGATLTPTVADPFAAGDSWTVALAPAAASYHPVSADMGSAAVHFYRDGQLRPLLGARGTFALSFKENAVPTIAFDMKGLWAAPTVTAPPLAAPAGFARGLPMSFDNTPVVLLHGHPVVLKALDIQLGASPAYKDRPGRKGVVIGNHPASGSIEFEFPRLADFDVEGLARSDALGALRIVHGTTPGTIVQLDAARVQLTEPDMQEDSDTGVILCRANLSLPPSDAGDDDFILTIR